MDHPVVTESAYRKC